MALYFKPHTVTVKSHALNKGSRKEGLGHTYTDTYTIKVQITAKTISETFTEMQVEVNRPHKMLFELADAKKIKVQDRIAWGDRLFTVTTRTKISQHGLPTDHASVMLSEIDPPKEGDK